MYARVRDILATNYLELLGIRPSADFREIRRVIGRIEMEAEMGAASVESQVIEKAKVALGTDERALEYRVLARWSGDDVLGRWSALHDQAVEQLRNAARAGTEDAVRAVAAWLEAHTDAALDTALGTAGAGREPLQWVADVAEDYLSAVLVPGGAVMTAAQLRSLSLRRFPATRAGLWSKLVQCRHAEAEALADELPEPDAALGPPMQRLSEWFRRCKGLLNEVIAVQAALREVEREEGSLPLDLFSARESLGDQAAGAALVLGILMFRRDAYRATIELLELAARVDCRPTRRDNIRENLEFVAQYARGARTRDRSAELEPRPEPAPASRVRHEFRGGPPTAAPPPFGGWPAAQSQGTGSPASQSGRPPGAPPPYPGRGHPSAGGRRRVNWAGVAGTLAILAIIGGGIASSVIDSTSEDDPVSSSGSSSSSFTPASSSVRFTAGQCVIWNPVDGSLTPASCSRAQAARILDVFRMSGSTYPTEAQFERAANVNCPSSTESFVFPTEAGWRRGDREVICLDR
ncbi:MAG: hypothetical protein KatS3mg064_1031 [Tepidiforma sp.]|nr:hypothetical protein [Tepidiforma sp.]GIW17874.1 MAG: hypothetical protein KatS3mg064_1031 [Tepidiforma sp.]